MTDQNIAAIFAGFGAILTTLPAIYASYIKIKKQGEFRLANRTQEQKLHREEELALHAATREEIELLKNENLHREEEFDLHNATRKEIALLRKDFKKLLTLLKKDLTKNEHSK